jgi:arylsulfatase A-like enzyme
MSTPFSNRQPNVIVFFTDQQRWDTTGVHGNPLGLTPNFDRMAARGTSVFNSFTCQPVCGPARACLQTGLYATRVGCYRNGIPLPRGQRTLASCFNEGGYDTAYVGKWHLSDKHDGPVEEADRGGYRYWLASNVLEFTSDAYHTTLYDNNQQPVKLPGYRVDAVTDAAIRYMAAPHDRPFFLFVSYIEPHFQNSTDSYPAPIGYEEQYTGQWVPPDLATLGGSAHQHIAGYYGMVKRLDEALGRLLDGLLSLGILDDTIVLFTSDHGNHFKTRNSEYKRSCHDASIRVPTALRGRIFDGGGHIRQMVSLVDLPPTLLDACGLPVPSQMQGRSLVPIIKRTSTDWPDEAFVQISESQVGRAIRTPKWKYGVVAPDKDPIQDSGSDVYVEKYLYDLEADPYELRNLAGNASHNGTATLLRERLIRRMEAAGEPVPQILSPAPR